MKRLDNKHTVVEDIKPLAAYDVRITTWPVWRYKQYDKVLFEVHTPKDESGSAEVDITHICRYFYLNRNDDEVMELQTKIARWVNQVDKNK